jgi:hypothetical protein
MKKWIVMLTVLLVAAGCGNMSTWVMTGQDTDLTTRVGIEAADGVEAGITAKWDCASEIEWGPEPDQIGPYAILTASWLVSQEDTGPQAPPPMPWFEGLVAIPYAGVDFVDDVDNGNFSNLQPNWIFGTKFLLDPDGRVAIVAEYIDGDQAREINVGLMATF